MMPPTSVGSRRVFVDTSAYFALIDAQDANHSSAQAIADELSQEPVRLLTTNFIIAETHALFLSRMRRDIALSFLREIDNSSTTIVRATAKDEQHAREILQKYRDRDFSLCDAISFAVMGRLNISSVFSFDRHFVQYGFAMVTARNIGR